MNHIRLASLMMACTGALSVSSVAVPQDADVIYRGEKIITMDQATQGARAIAVSGERILAVGSDIEIRQHQGENTRVVDLGEQALLPGFIDAHGHFSTVASLLDYANLSPPPVGEIIGIAGLQGALARHIETHSIPAGQWVVGFGYDDSLLLEGRHPDRNDLDVVTTDHPVFLIHTSGHLGAVNSMALKKMNFNAQTENPAGGVIRREQGSDEPDGVLEESAAFMVYGALPQPSIDVFLSRVIAAQNYYASHGITTVQDGAAFPEAVEGLNAAAEQGKLFLDIVAYPMWAPDASPIPSIDNPGTYQNRFRTGGVKLVLDGSPQGKTAYLSEPYHVVPPGEDKDYAGYPRFPDNTVNDAVAALLKQHISVLAHCNGDAAAEQLINAVALAGRSMAVADSRVVMIHAQTVRDDQLDRMAVLGMVPSFFSAHTFFWGDWHRDSVLGPRRAERISPAASALERGIVFTVHNDAPVTPPNPIDLIWSTVNRRTRSGDILGPLQRISTEEAIKAVTINAAFQYFEEEQKGSISAGKQADLVVLSANPLEIEPSAIRSLEVVETISRGKTVFRLKPGPEQH